MPWPSWPTENVRCLTADDGWGFVPSSDARRLAQTGEGIKECELLKWFVKEGDAVQEFEPICEVQSDKATVAISSPYSGTIRSLHHNPGDIVQVGAPLADIFAVGDEASEPEALDSSDVSKPLASEDRDRRGGDYREDPSSRSRPDAILTPESPETLETTTRRRVLTSPAVRRLARELQVDLHQIVGSGPDGRILKSDVHSFVSERSGAPVLGPAAAVDLDVSFEEPGFVSTRVIEPRKREEERKTEPIAPETTVVPLKGYRRAMARTMAANASIPHFHLCEEVHVDTLKLLRDRLRNAPELDGSRLTFMPFFIKATATALQDFPMMNASFDPDRGVLLRHPRVNVGVAIATPEGLVVPNIKDAAHKSIADITAELTALQEAAAANLLTPEDVSGGTFTLSNIGSIGGTYATPLTNPPEVAIMAFGRIQLLPRFVPASLARNKEAVGPHDVGRSFGVGGGAGWISAYGGAVDDVHANRIMSNAMELSNAGAYDSSGERDRVVVPQRILSMSLGADHRVVDGAMLAGFAQRWKALIEEPGRLLIGLR